MPHRLPQINSLIQREINLLILREIDLPNNCLATITRVETAKNLLHSNIYVSVLPFVYTKKVIDKLNHSAGFLQSLLYKKLFIKPLPKIHFSADITEQKASVIETIIDKINKAG